MTEKQMALRLINVAARARDGAAAVTKATHQHGTSAFINVNTVADLLADGLVEVESYNAYWDSITLTRSSRIFTALITEGGVS
jgi:hypothetical protein